MAEGMSRWMAIDKERFSLTGTDCDRIGTAYTAFQRQGERCSQPAGSCLSHQIQDYLDEDMASIGRGESPRYLLSRHGLGFA